MGLLSREDKAEEKVTLNLKDIEFLLAIIADYRIKGTDISQAVNTIVKLQSFAKELKEYGIKPI